MASNSVYDVFTPTTQARLNFVPRKAVNDQFVDALRTPGKQLVVYGESGSGKSTLLMKKLQELYSGHITTRCTSSSTYESILLDAFDKLNPYYVEGVSSGQQRSLSAGLSANFSKLRASVDAAMTSTNSVSGRRSLPPQLTAQRLGELLGAQQLCWVMEDFHKVPPEEKTFVSQALKVFSDLAGEYPHVKIVAVGATDTARQVVEYDSDLGNRVSELLVPLMDSDELHAILEGGERLLNVDLSAIAVDVVQYSVGVASICHHLGLNVCLERGVENTAIRSEAFGADDLKGASERYVRESSDSLKSTFERALKRHKVRKFDNCRIILKALAAGPLEGMIHNEILATIRKTYPGYPAGNLTKYLNDLRSEDRGSVLRVGQDGKYRFVEPIYHTFVQASLGTLPRSGTGDSPLSSSIIVGAVFSEVTHLNVTWTNYLDASAGVVAVPGGSYSGMRTFNSNFTVSEASTFQAGTDTADTDVSD